MRGLVYASSATTVFSSKDLDELAATSASRNAEAGISGYLYYYEGHFTQYIEGDPAAVDSLFAVLRRDTRHTVLTAESDEDLLERRFSHWHMRRILREELVEISMEQVLTDHLLFLKRVRTDPRVDYQQSLWRMVDALSRVQSKLSAREKLSEDPKKGRARCPTRAQ